jgi:hypothetical protein
MPGVPFEGRLLGAYSQDSLRIFFLWNNYFYRYSKNILSIFGNFLSTYVRKSCECTPWPHSHLYYMSLSNLPATNTPVACTINVYDRRFYDHKLCSSTIIK